MWVSQTERWSEGRPNSEAFIKNRLAAYKYPRFIEFVDELPKTGDDRKDPALSVCVRGWNRTALIAYPQRLQKLSNSSRKPGAIAWYCF